MAYQMDRCLYGYAHMCICYACWDLVLERVAMLIKVMLC